MPAVAITLRLARSGDAQALALMSRELIETGLGWRYRPDAVCRLIHDPDTVALIACERAKPVGFAIMKFGQERAHLLLLAVQPGYRRHGIGRRLMQWLLASAATAGVASVDLELRADNRVARVFYGALAFAETARIPGYYQGRAAAIRMVRVLRTESPVPVRWEPPTLHRR